MDKLYEDMMDDILADYGIVDEAKRIKGKEYKIHKGLDRDPDDRTGSDDNSKTNTVGSTSLGSTVIDSSVQKYISNIDVEKEKSIVKSENILEEYFAYIGGNITSAIEKYSDNNKSSQIEKRMVEEIGYMQENGFSPTDINNYIIGNYYGFDEIAKKLGYKDAIEYNEKGSNDKETTTKISNIIRSMLKLRLNYVNKIIQLLSQMVQANYKQLGLSEQQMKAYLESLSKGDNSSTQTADEIYKKIRENSKQYEINGGEGYDFRKLGFGCIFGPSEGMKLNFSGTDGTNKDAMLKLIQSAMRYDAVVVAHGSSVSESEEYGNKIKYQIKHIISEKNGKTDIKNITSPDYFVKKYKNLNGMQYTYAALTVKDIIQSSINNNDDDFIYAYEFYKHIQYLSSKEDMTPKDMAEDLYSIVLKWIESRQITEKIKYELKNNIEKLDFDKDITNEICSDKEIISTLNNYCINKLINLVIDDYIMSRLRLPLNDKNMIWGCQPTKTLNDGPFNNVNDVVRQLIKEGFKKIKIEDCNPGHHRLADDIMKTKGVLINHSDFSNYAESGELYSNDPSLQYLIEVENDLKSLALEYDIDYNNDEYLEECMQWYNDNYEVIQEGAWDSIKEFAGKIIGAIIGFFKKIVGYVRTAITKAKELIFGSKDKPKNTKSKTPKVKTKMINLSSKKIDEFISESREDLNNVWKTTSDTIAKEIKRQSDIQAKLSKALEEDLKRVGINPEQPVKKESSDMSDIEKNIKDDLDRVYENSIIRNFKWLFGDSIEEANLPGVNNDNDDDNDFTVGSTDDDNQGTTDTATTDDAGTDNTDDTGEEDNDFAVADAGGDEDTDNTDDTGEDNVEDTGDDEGEDDYTLPDAGEEGEGNEGEETGGEDDNNFDVDDAGEGGEGTDTGDDDPGMDDGGTTGDDLIGGNGSGDNVSDDVQIPNLRDVQQKLFDQLTPEQQQIKVDELKKNYADLYSRCANILKIITDSNPGDDNTVKVFDYVQKTMNDLQTHIYYYIANTFDTKTYIENDIQFKQFITILHTIKKILDEINGSGSNMDIEKKE